MTNETLQIIKRRRSCRAYTTAPVPRAAVQAVVEAGLYAPNGGGEAWHFTVVQNAALLERINRLAKQAAAQSQLPWLAQLGRDSDFHSLYHAPALILVSAAEDAVTSVYDVSAAAQNILLAAESLGLGACWGYFATQAFDGEAGEALRHDLEIPVGYRVYVSVMLGHGAEAPAEAPPRKAGLVTFID